MMAAVDEFHIEVLGPGGHAASPHETRDTVLAAAQVVVALQTLVSRRISPLESAQPLFGMSANMQTNRSRGSGEIPLATGFSWWRNAGRAVSAVGATAFAALRLNARRTVFHRLKPVAKGISPLRG